MHGQASSQHAHASYFSPVHIYTTTLSNVYYSSVCLLLRDVQEQKYHLVDDHLCRLSANCLADINLDKQLDRHEVNLELF